MDSQRVRIFDLHIGKNRTVNADTINRLIGNARSAEAALVAFLSHDSIGVLDPVSCASVEIRVPPWLSVKAGEYVRVLRDADRLVLVR